MRRRFFAVLWVCLIFAVFPFTAYSGEELFQYSTIDALLAGVYDGQLKCGELKKKGNLGLGTFNALDGEMVVLDGQVYQVKVDGKVSLAPDSGKIPFAAVTSFTPEEFLPVKKAANLTELTKIMDQGLPTKNIFYALKIEGRFPKVVARSVPRQTRPYPPLAKAVEKQAVFTFTDVEGTILGFRCPVFVKGVNVPGYHLHFLTKDRKGGGHVLDCVVENLTVQVDPIHKFNLVLPEDREFYRLDLDKDKSSDLKKVEK
ncbi:MAG: acetolactate decarboxylase [Deltaproteobacteria bacterium]|nr:acetolactate decarboxylase [Deltaproteobacteria bacterium]MBI4796499.1 acetolactate decarboxylase [Deltaproteobacteria bacterium]